MLGQTTFTNANASIAPGIPDFNDVVSAWADYDNDNDLDFVFCGLIFDSDSEHITQIWRNGTTGAPGIFTNQTSQIAPGIPGLDQASLVWVDYDNDNDLDLFISGILSGDTTYACELWKNNISDSGKFIKVESQLPSFDLATMTWGDYDNDGDADLLVAGVKSFANVQLAAEIWINSGGDVFTKTDVGLPGVYYPSVNWTDLDNDLDLDIVLTGSYLENEDYYRLADIWIKENGMYVPQHVGMTPVNGAMADCGDYDADGDLDVIIVGYTGSNEVTELWQNDNGAFTKAVENFLDKDGSANWGDYNNDGQLDLAICGNGSSPIVDIWQNSNGAFTNSNLFTSGNYPENAWWGDYDGDKDLDLLTIGADMGIGHTPSNLFRNEGTTPNNAPTKPTSLTYELAEDGILLKWSDATDDTTPIQSLTYNVRVGTTPGGNEIVSSSSDASGYHKLVKAGNASLNSVYKLKGLLRGTYYWSVQAIDNAYEGGAFAEEKSFTIKGFPVISLHDTTLQYSPTEISFHAQSTNTIGTITYSSSDESIAIVAGGVLKTFKPGVVTIIASQQENSEFFEASVSIILTIVKAKQTISFDPIPEVKTWVNTIDLPAKASSDLPVIFVSSDTAIAKPNGSLLDIRANGSCEITATQPGNDLFESATPVTQTLVVNRPILSNKFGVWKFEPSNKSVKVNPETNLSIFFNRTVVLTKGTLKVHYVLNGFSFTRSVELNSTNTKITSDSIAVISLADPLPFNGKIEAEVSAGAFSDLNGEPFKGVKKGEWSFETGGEGLLLVNTIPSSGAQDVSPDAPLKLIFNHPVIVNPGIVSIYDSQQGIVQQFALDSPNFLIIDSSLTIYPPAMLPYQSQLSVLIDADAITDAEGNVFDRLLNNTWTFTTSNHTTVGLEDPQLSGLTIRTNESYIYLTSDDALVFPVGIFNIAGQQLLMEVFEGGWRSVCSQGVIIIIQYQSHHQHRAVKIVTAEY